MRVFRSGGFAKDAIYLKGFRQVVDLVAAGASLDPFWLGKIAPEDVEAIEELLLRGLLQPPVFRPEFLSRDDVRAPHRPIARRADVRPPPRAGVRKSMLIAFFVNDIEREYLNYTTTLLAQRATTRGHRVCYITPSDFVLERATTA